eukprot:TRINITY_DN9091_c0_g1_i5.p1 TRINITY_DN9091_c0_g1~~TRINITY_DN9091_c0_g1_i5.p1  ORF type:complete len:171 (-),score=34.70 TRINITY_DN9091_c0_g1_i5:773-1285(-)
MHVRQYDLDMRDFDMNYMKKNTLKTYLIVFISILYSLVTMQKPQSKKDLYSKTFALSAVSLLLRKPLFTFEVYKMYLGSNFSSPEFLLGRLITLFSLVLYVVDPPCRESGDDALVLHAFKIKDRILNKFSGSENSVTLENPSMESAQAAIESLMEMHRGDLPSAANKLIQ